MARSQGFLHVHQYLHMHTMSGIVAECGINVLQLTRPPGFARLSLPAVTTYRTHQITPTLIGDGPWGEGLALLDLHGQTGAALALA